MKNKLVEQHIIRVMREEYERKLHALEEKITPVLYKDVTGDDGVAEKLISAGLKIKHVESGLLYTVDSVGPSDVILVTPEGDKFIVDRDQLEDEYELD